MAGSGMMSTSAGSDDGNDGDGRKGYGKRELSTSKRAAQNRAAQVSYQFHTLISWNTVPFQASVSSSKDCQRNPTSSMLL